MIKRHFDMRLVFHRPYKCMCSAVKYSQGQLLRDRCLRLDEAQEREEEKELAMKWCA